MIQRITILAEIFAHYGISVSVYSGKRSAAEQKALYAKGHTTLDGIKRRSRHQDGRAVDLVINPPYYDVAGYVWEQLGGKWGGNFSDPALAAVEFQHFEE